MAGNLPLILSDNLFDTAVLHPTSSVLNSGGDDVAGNEVWRMWDNLRDATFWTCTGTNAARQIVLTNPSAVAPTMLLLDRGHNLAGATITLAASTDDFVSSNVTQYTATIPSSAGGTPGASNGCVTEEGVWWAEFTPTGSFAYWELQIPALGAGIAPVVTGLYLGTAYRFPEYCEAPAALDYRTSVTFLRNVRSRAGIRIKSRPLCYGMLSIKFQCEASDYPAFDANVRTLLKKGAPWWFCQDDSDATQSGLCRLMQLAGDTNYDPQADPVHRNVQLELEEVYPQVLT